MSAAIMSAAIILMIPLYGLAGAGSLEGRAGGSRDRTHPAGAENAKCYQETG
jgi:hypothetical protein